MDLLSLSEYCFPVPYNELLSLDHNNEYRRIIRNVDIKKLEKFFSNQRLNYGFRQILLFYIDNCDIFKIAEKYFRKEIRDNKEMMRNFLNKALFMSYNDILDYILDNYNLESFFINFPIRCKVENLYGWKRILEKFPNCMDKIENWSINCDLSIAKEIRFYGYGKKLDPKYCYIHYEEFLKDCSKEIYLEEFLIEFSNRILIVNDIFILINLLSVTDENFKIEYEIFKKCSKITKGFHDPDFIAKIDKIKKRYN